MDPVLGAALAFIGKTIASAVAGQAVGSAMPQYGTTQPLQPQPAGDAMDFNRLLQQQQPGTQQPRLQIQNRLPRPGAY